MCLPNDVRQKFFFYFISFRSAGLFERTLLFSHAENEKRNSGSDDHRNGKRDIDANDVVCGNHFLYETASPVSFVLIRRYQSASDIVHRHRGHQFFPFSFRLPLSCSLLLTKTAMAKGKRAKSKNELLTLYFLFRCFPFEARGSTTFLLTLAFRNNNIFYLFLSFFAAIKRLCVFNPLRTSPLSSGAIYFFLAKLVLVNRQLGKKSLTTKFTLAQMRLLAKM